MIKVNTNQEQKLQTLRLCRYFSNLDDVILEGISTGMQLYRYGVGEHVLWEGEPPVGLHIIEAGRCKLYKISQQGRELVINVLREGESFNEVAVFDGGENPVNVAAIEETTIWTVRNEDIQASLEKYPQFGRSVILNLSKNLRMLVIKIEELSFFQVTTRLARLIVELSDDELRGDPDDRLTRDEMAARLGTVREVVVRSLKELERSGAVHVYRRKIDVVDQDILKEWAQN
jgi:CRP/FNR family transcriptional regulator